MSGELSWNTDKSKSLYGISKWGMGFFDINQSGHVCVQVDDKPEDALDLHRLVTELRESGVRLPLLVRFSNILEERIKSIHESFQRAIDESDYQNRYIGVFPIKVNQQRHLVEEVVKLGRPYSLGLECGSKPELLISLAMMDNLEAFIVCNGFKDKEYIETALLSHKLGRKTFIVVDRMEEIDLIIEASKKLNIKPYIGFRCKLNHKPSGKWSETSGVKSKFGLTPSEIIKGVKQLEDVDLLDCLQLLHFHIGSQVPSIQSIKSSIKEGARFYTELKKMAPSLSFIDVGGGLGVDYDGSGCSDSSTNYTEQQYANDVVYSLKQICDEKNVSHPTIISESGRALVAHSSVLIFEVIGRNKIFKTDLEFEVNPTDSPIVKAIHEIYDSVSVENFQESYSDLIEKRRDTLQLFTYGVLDLTQRAKAEDLYWATSAKMVKLARGHEELENIKYELEKELTDIYFCNFSLFQSLPDAWALKQVFPVMPIHRLQHRPAKRAILVDLTCDSDGKLNHFIDSQELDTQAYLEVHRFDTKEPYYLAAFMTGAYQEILGDLHNLFGDTDAVHISVKDGRYSIDHVIEGDSVTDVLNYVQYNRLELLDKVRRSNESAISDGKITRPEAKLLLKHYEEGLSGYTYFVQPEGE
jgi:arginine decarboxylase